jgi:hypothetical protein
MPNLRKILLIKEGIYADLISEGAHVSRIRYTFGGVLFDVVVENDEFEIINDYEWKEEE